MLCPLMVAESLSVAMIINSKYTSITLDSSPYVDISAHVNDGFARRTGVSTALNVDPLITLCRKHPFTRRTQVDRTVESVRDSIYIHNTLFQTFFNHAYADGYAIGPISVHRSCGECIEALCLFQILILPHPLDR
jgi:hypothetical protein